MDKRLSIEDQIEMLGSMIRGRVIAPHDSEYHAGGRPIPRLPAADWPASGIATTPRTTPVQHQYRAGSLIGLASRAEWDNNTDAEPHPGPASHH